VGSLAREVHVGRNVLAFGILAALVGVGFGRTGSARPKPPHGPDVTPRAALGRPAAQKPAVPSPADSSAARSSPQLVVKIAADTPARSLRLTHARYGVRVTGFLAETTATLTFRNDFERPLEADLVFPLPEGASLSGYALDVAGTLVDGVVVERQQARVAFETEVRKGIDPGLAEWAQGNSFRTRIWPVPARGVRTVRVRYVSELVTRTGASSRSAAYQLPLRFDEAVDLFEIELHVVKAPGRAEVKSRGLPQLHFEDWEQSLIARGRLENARLDEDLEIAVPEVPRETVVVERDPGGAVYFAIDDFPVPPPAPSAGRPSRVVLWWDASLSRAAADHRRERDAVAAWLARLGDVDVDLIAFRDAPETARSFKVRSGDARELLAALEGIAYDGGTRLDVLRFSAVPAGGYHVLVSDGLATLGDRMPTGEAPVFALGGGGRNDATLLRRVAASSGGAYLDLAQLSAADAAARIGSVPFAILAVDAPAGAVADVSPEGREPISGRVTLAGRLTAPEAEISVRLGYGGGASETRRFVVRRDAAVAGTLLGRLWAQRRIAALLVAPQTNHDALLDLGRRFGIVTPGASLLVLERVEQYVEHHVEPPASQPALREEYGRRVAQERLVARKSREQKLDQVAALWQARVSWWQSEYRYPEHFRVGEPKIDERPDARLQLARPAPTTAPAAPPPPAALEEPAPDMSVATRSRAMAGKKEDAAPAAGGPTISLRAWEPDTPYLRAMSQAGTRGDYPAYLHERETYGSMPAFFLDCADHFFRSGRHALGVRVLTSVLELDLAEPRLLRIAAHRLQQEGELDTAIALFEGVLRERPEEPQSLRDLALALSARADRRRQAEQRVGPGTDLARAADLLYRIVLGTWDGRFPEVEILALEDLNRIFAVLEAAHATPAGLPDVDPRLRRLLDVDVRIVLTWDTDNSDMDLWVTEPSGEKCFYSHPRSVIGGLISRDFTGGYGPEEYMVRRAMPGTYKIQANYYGSRSQQLTGPTTVQATVITNFGRADETRRALTLRLTDPKQVVEIGDVEFRPRVR
jgi:Ca-activated chloride channel family protein